MSSRRPKLRLALRLIAAASVLLWLSASSYCSLEHLLERAEGSRSLGPSTSVAAANERADGMPQSGAAHESHDGEENGHDSHPHDDEGGTCCSTLHATAQTPQPVFHQPVFHTVAFLILPVCDQALALAAAENGFDGLTRRPERVFTPAVCLGPAFRSHAPPLSA